MSVLRNILLSTAMILPAIAISIGCSRENATQPAPDVQPSADWKAGLDEDIVVSLSKLSEEDRRAALAQQECPVTDKPLGSMDTPVKISVQGEDVFLCCAGCEATIRENPEKYIAKLRN